MKRLLTLDEGNYTNEMPVHERWNVRAVIYRDGRLAMERSRLGEFKFPGGTVDPEEGFHAALCREVREETGLLVIPESIHELGEILELREDLFHKGVKYVCHSLFYRCEVKEHTVATAKTESEIQQGLHLHWETPEHIAAANEAFRHKRWIARDTAFLWLWMEQQSHAAPPLL